MERGGGKRIFMSLILSAHPVRIKSIVTYPLQIQIPILVTLINLVIMTRINKLGSHVNCKVGGGGT